MRFRKLWIPAVLAMLLLFMGLTGCGIGYLDILSGTPETTITPSMAYSLIEENEGNPDFVILDVRTPEEYAGEHIAGSILLDFYADEFQSELGKLDKNKTFLLYCRSDNRSSKAVDIMLDLGFTDVYDIDGGINQWKAEGYPTVQ